MTDMIPAPDSEPARDVRLGVMLRETIGATPEGDVDWTSLAKRIGDRLPMPMAAPWWSYAARWERRAIPLALAAGIMGVVALWDTTAATRVSSTEDLLAAVASGSPAADVAMQFTSAFTDTVESSAGLPE